MNLRESDLMPEPMPSAVPYDPSNVFAKILRGELPCARVFEDADTLAFMDIMPRCDGHTLVIPKAAVRNILDATPAQLAVTMRTTQHVSRAVMHAFAAGGVTIQQFNEAAGGQEVFHLHFHVLPRRDGERLKPHTGQMAPRDVLEQHAAKIRAALTTAA
jgi:histidine triad (HIT) family protein